MVSPPAISGVTQRPNPGMPVNSSAGLINEPAEHEAGVG